MRGFDGRLPKFGRKRMKKWTFQRYHNRVLQRQHVLICRWTPKTSEWVGGGPGGPWCGSKPARRGNDCCSTRRPCPHVRAVNAHWQKRTLRKACDSKAISFHLCQIQQILSFSMLPWENFWKCFDLFRVSGKIRNIPWTFRQKIKYLGFSKSLRGQITEQSQNTIQ